MSKFIPIEDFIYSWRWTDPNYSLIPKLDLAKIQALSPSAAQQIYSNKWSDQKFQSEAQQIPASENIKSELQALSINDSTEIYISWLPETAVVTTWNIFYRYWDDFCYPGDDVLIRPLVGNWELYYFHEEVFFYKGVSNQSFNWTA